MNVAGSGQWIGKDSESLPVVAANARKNLEPRINGHPTKPKRPVGKVALHASNAERQMPTVNLEHLSEDERIALIGQHALDGEVIFAVPDDVVADRYIAKLRARFHVHVLSRDLVLPPTSGDPYVTIQIGPTVH